MSILHKISAPQVLWSFRLLSGTCAAIHCALHDQLVKDVSR